MEQTLRTKLRKLEALHASTTHNGEKVAASEAIKRIKERLKPYEAHEQDVEMQFSIEDRWSRDLFYALCKKYNLRTYKYLRQHRKSIMVKAPKSSIDKLWAEFNHLNSVMATHIKAAVESVIKTV